MASLGPIDARPKCSVTTSCAPVWLRHREVGGRGSRDKKLYFGDPLLQTAVLDRTPGLNLDRAATVENVVALSLFRRYESVERQADGAASPLRLRLSYEAGRRTHHLGNSCEQIRGVWRERGQERPGPSRSAGGPACDRSARSASRPRPSLDLRDPGSHRLQPAQVRSTTAGKSIQSSLPGRASSQRSMPRMTSSNSL